MTSSDTTSPNRHLGVPSAIQQFLELASLSGAFLYGLGWLGAVNFYRYFGTTPEEVGVGFLFITARVALLAVLGAAVIGFLVFLLSRRGGWRQAFREPFLTLPYRATRIAILSVLVVLISMGALTLFSLRPWAVGSTLIGILLTIGSLILLLVVTSCAVIGFAKAIGFRAEEQAKVSPYTAAVVFAFVLMALFLVVTFSATRWAALQLRAGNTIDSALVQTADVYVTAPRSLADIDPCPILLGGSNSVSVLWSPSEESLIRAGNERIILQETPQEAEPC